MTSNNSKLLKIRSLTRYRLVNKYIKLKKEVIIKWLSSKYQQNHKLLWSRQRMSNVIMAVLIKIRLVIITHLLHWMKSFTKLTNLYKMLEIIPSDTLTSNQLQMIVTIHQWLIWLGQLIQLLTHHLRIMPTITVIQSTSLTKTHLQSYLTQMPKHSIGNKTSTVCKVISKMHQVTGHLLNSQRNNTHSKIIVTMAITIKRTITIINSNSIPRVLIRSIINRWITTIMVTINHTMEIKRTIQDQITNTVKLIGHINRRAMFICNPWILPNQCRSSSNSNTCKLLWTQRTIIFSIRIKTCLLILLKTSIPLYQNHKNKSSLM